MAPPLGETSGVSCPPATKQGGGKKRLEIKKWSAVALWGWGESSRPPRPPGGRDAPLERRV